MHVFRWATTLVALIVVGCFAPITFADGLKKPSPVVLQSPDAAPLVNGDDGYYGACAAQIDRNGRPIEPMLLWEGVTDSRPPGNIRCPVGMDPAVLGDPVPCNRGKGGRNCQDPLDRKRAILAAPQHWDNAWCSLPRTAVLPGKMKKASTVAVWCVYRDPQGISGLHIVTDEHGKRLDALENQPAPAPVVTTSVVVKDGKNGLDGDQVFGGIGLAFNPHNGAWGPRADINFRTGWWTGGISLSYLNGPDSDYLHNHEGVLSIRPLGFDVKDLFHLSGLIEGWRSGYKPEVMWLEQGVGFGLEAGVHFIGWFSDNARLDRAVTLNAKWLTASAVDYNERGVIEFDPNGNLPEGTTWVHDRVGFGVVFNLSELLGEDPSPSSEPAVPAPVPTVVVNPPPVS